MEHKLQQGDIAIIKKNNSLSPIKIKVLEVTETTYYLANMDENQPPIQRLDDAANRVINTEYLPQKSVEEIVNDFKKYQGQWLVQDETEWNIKFRIEKKEFELSYRVIEVISTTKSRAEEHFELIATFNK